VTLTSSLSVGPIFELPNHSHFYPLVLLHTCSLPTQCSIMSQSQATEGGHPTSGAPHYSSVDFIFCLLLILCHISHCVYCNCILFLMFTLVYNSCTGSFIVTCMQCTLQPCSFFIELLHYPHFYCFLEVAYPHESLRTPRSHPHPQLSSHPLFLL
jgi:hypothetical protein